MTQLKSLRIRTVGQKDTPSFRVFLENENGKVISPFHDIPLFADESKGLVNMFVEIPRWTNAKLEICTSELLNPVKQDVKKGQLRYVKNVYPFNGYPWNYGALPQTWEDPNEKCPHTQFLGDKDPIDVIDIGEKVAFIGQVKVVKVLGAVALLDEGETDWKIVAIDVEDPLASKLNDIDDVTKHCPGLLESTRQWFKVYKIPDGKPENAFGLKGEYQNKEFALKVISETNLYWKNLIQGKTNRKGDNYEIDCTNVTVEGSKYKLDANDDCLQSIVKGTVQPLSAAVEGLPSGEVTRSYYGLFPSAL